EFADNLKTIVQLVRGFHGTPILITPRDHRIFDDKGKVYPFFGDRSAVVRDVAAQTQTYLIDLYQMTIDLYNQLGKSESDYISFSATDYLHYTQKGAEVIAGLVVNALPDNLGTYLVEILNQPTKP
ncbi:MAG: hypothetical protein ABI651_17945, partial [Verrucomicrobiota bacterium]